MVFATKRDRLRRKVEAEVRSFLEPVMLGSQPVGRSFPENGWLDSNGFHAFVEAEPKRYTVSVRITSGYAGGELKFYLHRDTDPMKEDIKEIASVIAAFVHP